MVPHPRAARLPDRREQTAGIVDDPDAYFFENYKCGSPHNALYNYGRMREVWLDK